MPDSLASGRTSAVSWAAFPTTAEIDGATTYPAVIPCPPSAGTTAKSTSCSTLSKNASIPFWRDCRKTSSSAGEKSCSALSLGKSGCPKKSKTLFARCPSAWTLSVQLLRKSTHVALARSVQPTDAAVQAKLTAPLLSTGTWCRRRWARSVAVCRS
ncbi:hypothetical protein BKA80DRAFT_286836 [Phyllosticta citrichinensis]